MTTSESLYVEYNIYSVKLHEKHPPSLFAVVTWTSCSLSRSSVTPSDLIPLTRQAACTSFTFRLATPSSAMSWINTVHTKHLLPTTSRFNSQERKKNERKKASSYKSIVFYLVICTDGSQLHDELEAEEVVGPDGLQLQETAESHQLRSGQVVQSQLVLEQFGELQDLLITGTFTRVPNLCRWTSYDLKLESI